MSPTIAWHGQISLIKNNLLSGIDASQIPSKPTELLSRVVWAKGASSSVLKGTEAVQNSNWIWDLCSCRN